MARKTRQSMPLPTTQRTPPIRFAVCTRSYASVYSYALTGRRSQEEDDVDNDQGMFT